MKGKPDDPIVLDAAGFNEVRMCRSGPMVYNRNDQYIGRSLARYGEYSHGEAALFEQFVKPGWVVVEAGANIGTHTVALSKLAGASGQVHAFEPQRLVFQTLCANLALNQCANVHARQAGIGRERGRLVVPALDPRVAANFGGVVLGRSEGDESVDVLTIDDLDLPMCHFIKVDVEGMELDVVRGANATLAAYRPVLYLENDRDEASRPLFEALFALDYDAWWHIPPLFNADNWFGESDDLFPNIVSINVLCLPREAKARIDGLAPVRSADQRWTDAA